MLISYKINDEYLQAKGDKLVGLTKEWLDKQYSGIEVLTIPDFEETGYGELVVDLDSCRETKDTQKINQSALLLFDRLGVIIEDVSFEKV